MGTGSDWLPIVAAKSSRWWYPWTLYASPHSTNAKSAGRFLITLSNRLGLACEGVLAPFAVARIDDNH